MKRVFKACWQGSRFCVHCLLSFGIWTIWLVLVLAAGLQLYVATAQELAVPRFILREISSRFSASGLRLDFDRARFDPSGRLFVEGVSIVSLSFGEPLLTARSLYLRLDPWNLLIREITLDEIEASAVDLYVPAMLSPTGRGEPVIRDLHAVLRFREDDSVFSIPSASARYANLTLTASGEISAPPAQPQDLPVLDEIVRNYLRVIRRAAFAMPHLEALTHPRLAVVFSPDEHHLAHATLHLQADELVVPADPFRLPAPLRAASLDLHSRIPLRPETPVPISVRLTCRSVEVPGTATLTAARATLTGELDPATPGFSPHHTTIAVGRAAAGGLSLAPATLTMSFDGDDRVRGHLDAGLQGEPWTVAAEGNPRTRDGTLHLAGRLPRTVFEWVARRFDERLNTLVKYEESPAIAATVDLAPGGKVASANGTLETGPVTARNVPLSGVRARFAWAGTDVEVEDIELRTSASIARGSYTMDTNTRAFRFLLKGSLQPEDINGWFRDWWPRFWSAFDFSRAAPTADVDVAGQWGEPRLTTVFVGADAAPAGLRGVSLDKLHARLFVRPGFVDALYFHGEQAGRHASGRFARTQNLEARSLAFMEFAIEGNLPAEDAARLAGPQVIALAAPYRFSAEPDLKVAGRVHGPGAEGGPTAALVIEGRTDQPMTFHDFPLSSLAFKATVDGERVFVDDVVAGFAEGVVRGQGELSGPPDNRRLAFDGELDDAALGLAIRTVEEFSARRQGVPPPPQSRFQQQIATGRLDLAVSAEGRRDDIRSFQGSGNALIAQANLGEVNLLGILSTLLRRTLLNYSTLQLDTARANFRIEGPQLVFPEVRITGPRAAIDASGSYDFNAKDLDFLTKVYPFEESRGLLGSALGTVLAPLSAALEVKLTGRLDNPSWAFVYGPTSLFRAITGAEPSSLEENQNGSDKTDP
jgi:hypothetical protein